jgi:hypothetical protein
LKPGGALISDFVLENDRTGHPFALLFHSTMLLDSRRAVWQKADYEACPRGGILVHHFRATGDRRSPK